MPHSSGGGSHSGGSYNGSSGGGDHSGGFSRTIRTSHTYFPGAYRYVSYHNGKMNYIYSDSSKLNQSSRSKLSLLFLIFYIPFIVAGFFLMTQAVHVPRKMKVSYSPAVEVFENTFPFRVSSQEQLLVKQGASALYKATGVPICVVFDDNSSWKSHYFSLKNYAYNLYVNRYTDENHWLLVYTDDGVDRQDKNSFSDWYFEGMQGDNTDKYIPKNFTSQFNADLNRALTDKRNTTGQAFNIAFTKMAKNIGKVSFNFEMLLFALFWNIFIIIHIFFMVFYNPNKEYQNFMSCGKDSGDVAKYKEVRCPHCGGMYYKGTVMSCPHCGASLEQTNISTVNNTITEHDLPNGFDK